MKTPQIPAMPGMSPLGFSDRQSAMAPEVRRGINETKLKLELARRATDEKTVAERKWRSPLKPQADQKACDVGLFSDDSKQSELF